MEPLIIPALSDNYIHLLVEAGETIACGEYSLRVLAVPGHTRGHVAYYCETASGVWTGDTLFQGGCGRLLEGTAGRPSRHLRRPPPPERCVVRTAGAALRCSQGRRASA